MKKTVNINDKNYEQLRVYAMEQNITITTALNQAIEQFLFGRVMYDSIKELIESRLSKISVRGLNVKNDVKE